MNKYISHIVALIIAISVFFTGTGITIINYCCMGCVEQVFSLKQQPTCCSEEDHSSDNHFSLDDCFVVDHLSYEYTAAKSCSVSRQSIDLDTFTFKPQLSSPFVWITQAFSLYQAIQLFGVYDADYSYKKSPPKIPPREYLSLLRVLII